MAGIADLHGMEQDIVAAALRAVYKDAGVRSQDVNLFARTKPIRPKARLALANTVRTLPTEQASVYVFADLDPLSNWGHAARHLDYSSTVHVPGDNPVFQDSPSGSGATQSIE